MKFQGFGTSAPGSGGGRSKNSGSNKEPPRLHGDDSRFCEHEGKRQEAALASSSAIDPIVLSHESDPTRTRNPRLPAGLQATVPPEPMAGGATLAVNCLPSTGKTGDRGYESKKAAGCPNTGLDPQLADKFAKRKKWEAKLAAKGGATGASPVAAPSESLEPEHSDGSPASKSSSVI